MLSSFERVGGVEALVDTASRFGKAFSDLDSSDHPLQLDHVHIFSGLKVTLSLLQSLVSAKALFESPQTASITTKDRNATSDEDFDPYRFLVKLRLAIFPFIRECWTSSWLESASVSVIRSVIQTLLRIMDADSEEKPESVPAASLAGLPAPLQRPPPPPERIQQLVDMGFTASAATQALVRCHNNASLATEFLLSHPGAFDAPAAPAEEPAQPDAAPAQASTSVEASNSADAEMADASSGEESITKGKEKETEVQKTAPRWDEDRRSELSSWRDELRPDHPKRALALADRYEELVAEIKSAFLRSKDATKLLIDETVPLKADAFTESSAKMSVRLRLLSAVVREDSAAFRDDKELVEKTMSLIVDLLPSSSTKENSSNRPMWLPFQLLVAEGLFIMSEDIVEVAVDESVSESTDTPSLFTGPVFTHARQTFFARCLEILREDGLNREELSAALQILVLLTRDHALAVEFAKRDGVAAAMKVFKESDKKSTSGCQYYIAPILRHIVEEPQALLALMQREIKHWFSVPRSKVVDVAHFVKNTKQIALRNPSLFVQAVSNECALVQHQSQTGNYHIKLKPTEENAGEKEAKEKGENVTTELPKVPVESGSEMQVDEPTLSEPSPASGPDSEVLESMVHQLLGELLLSGKQAVSLISGSTVDSSNETPSDDTTSQTASTADASSSSVPSAPIPASSTAAETPASTTIPATAAAPAGLGDFVYSSLLMQNLTELLGSYMSCKTA
jgi:E3 ubiquitin-protein ligase HUWE1